MQTIAELLATLPQTGRVEWIGLRPDRDQAMQVVASAEVTQSAGVLGDRFRGGAGNPRQITLIQYEHLAVIAACLGKKEIQAQMLRRNIAVSGINLLALKGKSFRLGEAILEYSGLCHPCSKMERLLGPGGYNAMRGHGGITARVLAAGRIDLASEVISLPN